MSKKEKAKQSQRRWIFTVVCLSFALSVIMSLATSLFMDAAGIFLALLSLFVLVSIGVAADVIGTAVTSAEEQPLIAMASKRIPGAKQALRLVRRAERVSSLLNDVVGDIVGIVAGSAGSVIALYLVSLGMQSAAASVLIAACTSAFMIGSKAYGKGFALAHSLDIVLAAGKAMMIFDKKGSNKKKKSLLNRSIRQL